ncbi:MAG: hypothetical protein ACRDMV_07150 [Streptosporangiales bacterium]
MGDTDAATAYAATQPGFGGTYIDGDVLVVLFTEDVKRHEHALRTVVEHPEHLVVRATSRTVADVRESAARVRHRVLGSGDATDVSSVSVAVHAGEFVVEVGLDPHTDEREEQVRDAARPDPVVVRPQPHPRTL